MTVDKKLKKDKLELDLNKYHEELLGQRVEMRRLINSNVKDRSVRLQMFQLFLIHGVSSEARGMVHAQKILI